MWHPPSFSKKLCHSHFYITGICQCCSESEISEARLNNHVVLGRKSSLSCTGPTCQPITLPLTAWQWATVDSSHRGHSTISWKVRHPIVLKLFFNKCHTHYPGTCMGLFMLAWCDPIYWIPPNTGSHGMCQKSGSNTVSKSLPQHPSPQPKHKNQNRKGYVDVMQSLKHLHLSGIWQGFSRTETKNTCIKMRLDYVL